MTVRVSSSASAGLFAVVEYSLPAHCSGVEPHWHVRTTEWLYVVEGTVAVTCDEETVVVGAGAALTLPPCSIHSIWNPSSSRAIFLVCAIPGGLDHYCEALAGLDVTTSPDERDAIATKYDTFAPATPPIITPCREQ